MGSLHQSRNSFCMCSALPLRPFEKRCQLTSDHSLPSKYQCKQLATFFGADTSVRLVPLALAPRFLVHFPFSTVPLIGSPWISWLRITSSDNICFLGNVTILLKSSHFHGLFIWGLYDWLLPSFFHLRLHFCTSNVRLLPNQGTHPSSSDLPLFNSPRSLYLECSSPHFRLNPTLQSSIWKSLPS